jgi:DNA polymerase I-like protein with 3'-5' exonuclease and polymerase domains
MADKEFISQRINFYAGREIDPTSDKEVQEVLRSKFNIHLPQRKTLNESLAATISDHEIIHLIQQYRSV